MYINYQNIILEMYNTEHFHSIRSHQLLSVPSLTTLIAMINFCDLIEHIQYD